MLILGMSPFQASLSMIPLMIPMVLLAPMIPNIVKKVGARITMSGGLLLVSIAFVIMSTWTSSMSYWHFIGVMMSGICAAMTPGTNILMASVPRNRSGMGSAMNDTTRELGGALGIAVLGAILSAVYAHKIADVADQFTGSVKTALEGSLATALHVAKSLGPQAAALAESAKTAWMDALSIAALVAAGIIFVAAIVAFMALPKHTEPQSDTI